MNESKLNVLHLASYFSGISKVYEHLFDEIDKLGHTQYVYVPYRFLKKDKVVRFSTPDSKVILRPIYNQFSRFAYFYKINRSHNDIRKYVPITRMRIVHAHTWFTDGGLAYQLYKKDKIPYIVTVRSTDLNTFAKYFYHTHNYAREILLNAKKIIFLSEAYRNKVLQLPFMIKVRDIVEKKSVVLPNGVDSFWIENTQTRKRHLSEEIKLIYVGSFLKRKNIVRLIGACDLLIKKGYRLQLNLIGGSAKYANELKKLIEVKPYVNFLGSLTDKVKLAKIVSQNDIFVMPSYDETFGLVYIEALSQGLPVLYTKNDGIDGLYTADKIGEAVDPFNIEDIAQKLTVIIDSYEKYNFEPNAIVERHDWRDIVRKLVDIYTQSD